jgi:hypothetical protein
MATLASYAQINPRMTQSDVLVFELQDPRFSETSFVAVDAYCVQPSCPCRLVSLRIERVPESIELRDPNPERFFLHLDTLELQDAAGQPLDPEAFPVAHALRAELPAEAVALWRLHYDQGRAYGLEHGWRHRRWDDLEPGELLAWNEVREAAPILSVEQADGAPVGVVERYCPSPVCDCREVLLSIVEQDDDGSLREEHEALVRLSFDGRYEIDDPGAFPPERLHPIMRKLLQRPGSLKTFREHYQAIKKVGSELADRYPDLARGWGIREPAPSGALAAGGPRVGRNEPCPCGSGKKYKQCCGKN